MIDQEPAFDLAWAPKRYPGLKPDDDGAWTLVLDDSDDPIGVIWTNHNDGAGVLWVVQTPEVEKLLAHFLQGTVAQTPAGYAYNGARLVPGVKFGAEFSGKLSGAIDELNSISDELD